ILAVDAPLHTLFDAAYERPLLVRAGIIVDSAVHAISEVRVVDDIGRDDLPDVMLLVGLQPRRNEPDRGAVVGIGRDFRDRNEWGGRRVEPAGDACGG